jgi:hypothetical protein
MKKHVSSHIAALLVIYTMVLISACDHNVPKVDISTVSTELKVQRFESDLFGMDIERPAESIAKLKAEYGDFFDLYMFRITSLGTPDSIMMQERIVSFVSDTNFRAVANDISKTFGDFSEEKEQLTQAFKYYQYYFPDKSIPTIVTLLSAFSYPIVCDSFNLGIGLDMYLGKDYRYYNTLEPALPNYLRIQMEKSNVVMDAMKGWALSDYQIDEGSAKVIDMMISEGRVVTFLEYIIPDEEQWRRLVSHKHNMNGVKKTKRRSGHFLSTINYFSVQIRIFFQSTPTMDQQPVLFQKILPEISVSTSAGKSFPPT